MGYIAVLIKVAERTTSIWEPRNQHSLRHKNLRCEAQKIEQLLYRHMLEHVERGDYVKAVRFIDCRLCSTQKHRMATTARSFDHLIDDFDAHHGKSMRLRPIQKVAFAETDL